MCRNAVLHGLTLIAWAAVAAGLGGCSEDEPMKPKPPALCVSLPGWFVGGRGGASPVVTVTNCGGGSLSWTAESAADWLSVSRTAGAAPGSFQVIAAQNRTELLRSQSVVVTSAGALGSPRSIVVSQGPGLSSLCISTDELILPPEGVADAPIDVENCGTDTPFEWSAYQNTNWMTLSRSAGSEPGRLSVAAPPNYSAIDRSGAITVMAPGIDGSPQTILVSQPYSLLADPRHYEVGGGPVSLSVADFDGDGDPDIAVGNLLTDDVCVLKNRGDGTFAAPRFHILRMAPATTLCVDVDGDRKKDIIAWNSSYGWIAVLRNLGDGMFDMPAEASVGTYPISLAAADVDADGDADLAVVDGLRPMISILTADGDGTYSEPTFLDLSRISMVPIGVSFVDVDRDRDQDIVGVAESSTGCALVVLKNKGDGSFEGPVFNHSAHLAFACAMITSDFDQDGDNDIALLNGLGCGASYLGEYLMIFKNRNGGIFEETISSWEVGWATTALSAADLDLDGDADLIFSTQGVCENVYALRNDGAGSFAAPTYFSAGIDPSAIACADFDGDGDADVAVANAGSYTGVYTITVFKNFTRAPSGAAVARSNARGGGGAVR